jgi:ribosomal protein L37E
MTLISGRAQISQVPAASAQRCERCGRQLYQDLDGAACWACGWHDYRRQHLVAAVRRGTDGDESPCSPRWRPATVRSVVGATTRARRRPNQSIVTTNSADWG